MSIYRNTVFVIKGLKEFSKSGYASASKNFKVGDMDVDCSGSSYMITGANSGIGKVTALEVAKRGGTVHLICRNKERGEAALDEIVKESGNSNVKLHLLDMSKPRDVASFATEFAASGQQLNVLVNNAGCMVNERTLTADELEMNFATNTLGTYILTVCLIPVLSKSTDPRVITVSSGGMYTVKLDTKDLQFENMRPFDGTFAYAQNKRQQIVMTQQWATEHSNIHFSAMHPGWADTPAVRSSMPDFYEKMKNRLRTAEQGADTLAWLAIAKGVNQEKSGQFWQDRKATNLHLPLAWTKSTPAEEKELMSKLQELSQKFLQ